MNDLKKAWFSSLIFSPTSGRCLKFFYHMNGDGIGTLSINLVYDNGKKSTIWEQSGDKGDQWLEGNVGFDSMGLTYRSV